MTLSCQPRRSRELVTRRSLRSMPNVEARSTPGVNELPFRRRTSCTTPRPTLFLETTITITTPTYPLSCRIDHTPLSGTQLRNRGRGFHPETRVIWAPYSRYPSRRMNLALFPSRTVNVASGQPGEPRVRGKLHVLVPDQEFPGLVTWTPTLSILLRVLEQVDSIDFFSALKLWVCLSRCGC